MKKPSLTIFYQFNPWQSSIGGIQTIIRSFLKYAPDQFQVRLVGTGQCNSNLGTWQEADYAGRAIQFMPLISIQNDNVRGLIPTSVKYTIALLGRNLASDFVHFHRIEPTLLTLGWSGEKTLFIHNDIQQQIGSTQNNNAILWTKFPAVYYTIEKKIIQQFSQVHVCNTETLKFYRKQYKAIADRITYLKNIVDSEVFYPLSSEAKEEKRQHFAKENGLATNTHFILYAGRLHPQKDPILLIRSMAALQVSNVHLLIAGDGELAQAVRSEIAALQISQKVTMLGSVSQERLADLHRLSSVCILTSVYEGLPLVVLEALACGIPIVTTQSGETPNFLTSQSGVISRKRTPEAIAEALQKVLFNLHQYPAATCIRVAQPYSAKTVVQEVYQQMWQRWECQNLLSVSNSLH